MTEISYTDGSRLACAAYIHANYLAKQRFGKRLALIMNPQKAIKCLEIMTAEELIQIIAETLGDQPKEGEEMRITGFNSFLSKIKAAPAIESAVATAVAEAREEMKPVEISHADVAFSLPPEENNGVSLDALEEFLNEEEGFNPEQGTHEDLYNALHPKIERKKVTTKTGKEIELVTVKFPFNPRAIGIEIDMKDWRWYGAFGCWAKKESPEAKTQASHFAFEFMVKLAALGK